MAASEDIIAWCKQEQARLAQQLGELQSGRLRTYEKHAQAPGWLEIDTTEQSIARCRDYMSELSAIIAGYPQIFPPLPQPSAAPPAAPASMPQPRMIAPVAPQADPIEHGHLRAGTARHSGWVQGWGVVKGRPPRWQLQGIYETHAEADAAAAEAGGGYYARWGSYNERTKEFTSGPSFGGA